MLYLYVIEYQYWMPARVLLKKTKQVLKALDFLNFPGVYILHGIPGSKGVEKYRRGRKMNKLTFHCKKRDIQFV